MTVNPPLDGWYNRIIHKEGMELYFMSNDSLLITITLPNIGDLKGWHRPDAHTKWIKYEKQDELNNIWDSFYGKSKPFPIQKSMK